MTAPRPPSPARPPRAGDGPPGVADHPGRRRHRHQGRLPVSIPTRRSPPRPGVIRPNDGSRSRGAQPPGRAIALGHPPGASGAHLVGTVAHRLARRGGGTGVAALRIGVGRGLVLSSEH
nr:hypothetical protein [Streptomyces sp. CB01580]